MVDHSGTVFLEKERTISSGIEISRAGFGKSFRIGERSAYDKIGYSISVHIPNPSN